MMPFLAEFIVRTLVLKSVRTKGLPIKKYTITLMATAQGAGSRGKDSCFEENKVL
jgi:hypothetical protein